MEHMKKLAAALLAAAMTLSVSAVALAAQQEAQDAAQQGTQTTTYTITITNTTAGHTYEAYQIFAGDLASDGKTLSNIQWGSGVTVDNSKELFQTSASKWAESLDGKSKDSTEAKKFANDVSSYLKTDGHTDSVWDSNNKKYTISVSKPGYYLVKDKDATLSEANDSYTSYMLEVVGNVTVSPKSYLPTVVLGVQETDDTKGTTTDYQKYADYDVKDTIPFLITATLPSDLASYTGGYTMTFHIAMAGGLAMAEKPAVVVKLGEQTLTTSNYSIESVSDGDAYHVKVTLPVTNQGDVQPEAGGTVTVGFNGQLTSTNLVVGGKGNVCTVTMDYSNDPTGANQDSMGKTAASTATVFTYQLVVNKVRPTKEGESATYTVGSDTYVALPGAGFTLYKQVPKTQSNTKDGSTTENVTVATIAASDTGTQFVFTGLDAGTYILSETATPDGYNTIDDITFTIASTISQNSSTGLYYLSELTGSGASFSTSHSDGVYDGTLTTYVVNQAGVTLPETGGRGTTLLYIVGGLLVTGAGVLLVTRRRMEDQ